MLLLVLAGGCSSLRSSIHKEDVLRSSIDAFHLALTNQETVDASRFLSSGGEDRAEELLGCFQRRVRVIDYEFHEIRRTGDPKRAVVHVRVASHARDDLTVQDAVWEEHWYEENQSWHVRLDFEPFATLAADCLRERR
ncbi:MAG: hypothetical protein AB1640_07410 [bacterium]